MSSGAPRDDAPQHHWVECSVRIPGERQTETVSLAKVRCDDVVDALDLDRWGAVAFQHMWRSGHSRHAPRELRQALWYLKRATDSHNSEAKAAARLIRRLVAMADDSETSLRDVMLKFAREADSAEFSAVDLLHICTHEA